MTGASELRRVTRSLFRSPAYAIGVVVTLGLGAGVVSSALSATRAIFLDPLPHADGDRLVYLRQSAPGGDLDNALFSVPELEGLRRGVTVFEDVAEFSAMRFTALGLDRPREVRAGVVTGNYFEVMGLEPLLGRLVGRGDGGEDADAVVVLTAPFWDRVLGRDPAVVGRSLDIGGRSATVVGVVEPHPPYPERTDVYVNLATSPHHLSAAMTDGWSHRMTEGFARLRPGATLDEARRGVESVASRMRADHPEAYDERLAYTVGVRRLSEQLVGRARSVLPLLLGAAGVVLLVALANVANLALTRAHRLHPELVVRRALGASGRALRSRILLENVVLGGLAGVVGVVVSVSLLGLLASYASRFTIRAAEIGVGVDAVLSPVLLAVGSMLLLAGLPRLSAVGADAGRSGPVRWGRGALRAQRGFVAAQVAASVVLVTAGGLLASTLRNLRSVDSGLDTSQVVAMDVPAVRNGRTAAEIGDDYLEMIRALEARPEIERAALTNVVPFRLSAAILPLVFDFSLDGSTTPPRGRPYRADFRTVTEGYFDAVGIPLVAGRPLAATDDAAAPRVVVVNEAFVRTYLEGRDPLGRRVAWVGDVVEFAGVSGADRTIVGVVGDVLDDTPTAGVRPTVFMPQRQEPWGSALVVRARREVAGLAETAAETARSIVPDHPVENATSLEEARRSTFGDTLLNVRLVGALALATLIVAGVGLFAALASSVHRRRAEIALRIALGADRRRVVGVVMTEALAVVGTGLVVGSVASRLVAGVLEGVLYGVDPSGLAALLHGPATLLVVGAAAAWLPALRAVRTAPADVLARGG